MAHSASDVIASNSYALAMKRHLNNTVETVQANTAAWELVEKETMLGRKDDEDIVLGESGDAELHTPDTDLADGSLGAESRLISLEDKETYKNYKQTMPEFVTDHTNKKSKLPGLSGMAIAQTCEKHTLQQLILGARTAATSVRKSGILPTARAGSDLASAYPKTEAGSFAIQDALAESIQLMQERHVKTDQNDLFAFLPPYLIQVLRKDKTLVSNDYDGPTSGNSLIRGKLNKVEDFWIVPTTLMPSTDLSASTAMPQVRGTYQYRGDFSLTAFCAMKLGGLHGRVTPMANWMDWVTHRRRWDIGAGFFKGLGTANPSYCIEQSITGS